MAERSRPPAAQSSGGGNKTWPALVIEATRLGDDDLVAAALDDFGPAAIEDLTPQPLPPGGLWDPTCPPVPDPPPSPLHWRVFFHASGERERAAAALGAQFPELSIDREDVDDQDWAARSQQSLTAVRAGRFVVAPPWDLPAEDPSVTTIVIEPSRGFGTGHHASTRLCLQAMSDLDLAGQRVLDLGTGSGVLAMAAAMRGAREVMAVDVDPDAIEAAHQSAALNDLPGTITFAVGDFRHAGQPAGRYDVVLANLTGGMLMQSAAAIAHLVQPGGVLVMSGFDRNERDGVRRAFAAFDERAAFEEEGWIGLVMVRPV